MAHVLQTPQDLVISRCWFVEDSKEMYHELQRTSKAIVSLLFGDVAVVVGHFLTSALRTAGWLSTDF